MKSSDKNKVNNNPKREKNTPLKAYFKGVFYVKSINGTQG